MGQLSVQIESRLVAPRVDRYFSLFAAAFASKAEPASGGGRGATEAYVTLRSNIGLNQSTGTRAFQKGPISNIAIETGANLETKNSSFAPSERTIYFGPNLQIAVPRGYFNVGVHMRKEWNHEGVLGKSEDYDPDLNIEPTWMLPFTIGKVHVAYTGFADYNIQKGKDSFGSKTVGEFLLRNVVTLDVGALLFGRARLVNLDGGFWYWRNEYGKPSSDLGAEQMTPIFGLAFHLDGGPSKSSEVIRSAGKMKMVNAFNPHRMCFWSKTTRTSPNSCERPRAE